MDEIKIDNRIVPISTERRFNYLEPMLRIPLDAVGNVQFLSLEHMRSRNGDSFNVFVHSDNAIHCVLTLSSCPQIDNSCFPLSADH